MSDWWDEEQGQLRRYADGQYKQIRGGSWREWFSPPDLRLIPPLAEAFTIYGGKDTVERARAWALDGRYLLATGPNPCAHGLYMLGCPKLTGCLSGPWKAQRQGGAA